MFVLHSSKTHGEGCKPQTIKISSTLNCRKWIANKRQMNFRHFCPFSVIDSYIAQCKRRISEAEPFFLYKDHSAVTALHFRQMLKRILKHLGLDETLYSCHSMRVGRSVDLLEISLSIETIKKLGCWSNNSVFTYLKH